MPDTAGVIRRIFNLPTEAVSSAAAVTILPAGEAGAITGIYVSAGAAGSFTFTNAAGSVTLFTITLQAAAAASIPLLHPYFVQEGAGGFRVNAVPATTPSFCVWFRRGG